MPRGENHQLERFFSLNHKDFSLGVDAFSQSWKRGCLYAFSPFSLIPRVLKKKNSGGQSDGHINRSPLAKENLVPSTTSDGEERSLAPSRIKGSPRPCFSPGGKVTSSSSLDAERSVLSSKGLSDYVISTYLQSRKVVTSKMYHRILNIFLCFSENRSKSSDDFLILDFLQSGLEKGL